MLKMSQLVGKGCKMGGQDHGSEVAELIQKDRFYGKLLASWISMCSISFCSLTFVAAFWMLSVRWLGSFKQEQPRKELFWSWCRYFWHPLWRHLLFRGPFFLLVLTARGSVFLWTLSGPAMPELTLRSLKHRVGSLARQGREAALRGVLAPNYLLKVY